MTLIEPIVEETTQLGKGECAHIVKVEPGESGVVAVLDSRVNGTPLTALCGHVWVASKDPKQLPICQACKEIYELYRMENEGLNETPDV